MPRYYILLLQNSYHNNLPHKVLQTPFLLCSFVFLHHMSENIHQPTNLPTHKVLNSRYMYSSINEISYKQNRKSHNIRSLAVEN